MKNYLHRSAGLVMASVVAVSAVPWVASADDSELVDSGINYTEYVGTIGNPAVGYTTTMWCNCLPGKTNVYNPTADLVLFFIDIGQFSAGINGTKNDDGTYTEGTDYDLDETFLNAWDETLANCRRNGCMVALRFRYDANGADNPEPKTFEQVLRHIEQLKDSGLFEKYADIIAYVESGFVGKWGEQHGGRYTSLPYKAQLLEAMLQAVPDPIPVTVRTPDTFAEWAGIKRDQLTDSELIASLTESAYSKDIQRFRSRVGMYDDGYMGSNSDLGTYANREIETEWLGNQTLTSYFGGEFSGNIDFAKQYETYLPQNAIPEMYKTHLSYINANIFQLYKEYTFDESCDVEGVDNSAYYGQTAFQFIRDHLGYRYVLRDSKLTAETVQGGDVQVEFSIENTGFANQIPSAQSYIIIEKDGKFAYSKANIDSKHWLSCTKSDESVSFKLPDNIDTGDWNVYLKLSMGTDADIHNMTGRSIRFANEGVWDSSMGANYLGTVTVTESDTKGTNNSLKVKESTDSIDNQLFNLSGKTVTDGIMSSKYEWTDDMLVGENESGVKLYAKADDHYAYFMADIPKNGASAPVYNLQLKVDGEFNWLYYASNGFIYFNHDSYNGCQCRWSDDLVEYRIPFEVMGLTPGCEITDLRIFLQDSGNEWKLMSDVRAPKAQIPEDFVVLTADARYVKRAGESLTYQVIAELEGDGIAYEWSKDGEPIPDENSDILSFSELSESDSGSYSVTITSANGIKKTVEAFTLEVIADEPSDYLAGDANCDGKVTIADSTAILQSIVNQKKYSLSTQGELNADVDGNKGVTPNDALVIQQADAGMYELSDLPLQS